MTYLRSGDSLNLTTEEWKNSFSLSFGVIVHLKTLGSRMMLPGTMTRPPPPLASTITRLSSRSLGEEREGEEEEEGEVGKVERKMRRRR